MSPREKPFEGASNAPIAADFSTIPLPPEGAEGEAAEAVKPAPAEDVAVIEFLDPAARSTEIPLDFPFVWEGREVRGVTARRLTLGEVLRVSETAPKDADGGIALVHFYAVMIGLPAAVVRALDSDDSQRVQEGCFPFLPRSITGSISRSTGDT